MRFSLLSLIAIASFGGCDDGEVPPPERREGGADLPWTSLNGWSATVAADLGEKLGGCAVGNVDPARPGDEIVAVGSSGRVYLIAFENGAWVHEVLGQAPGEMVQCALGDVDPNREGDEIVVVGMAEGDEDSGGEGAAHVLFRQDGEWVMKEFHRSPALLHAACVAELDGTPGAEVVLAGYADEAMVLDLAQDNVWVPIRAGPLSGPGKNATVFRDGVAIACADGAVVHVRPVDGAYTTTVLDQAPAGCARLATDDDRLLVARDDGALGLLEADGRRTDIYSEDLKLRGAVLANLDPTSPALEAATAGYQKTVTVMSVGDDGWEPTTVFEGTDRFHHLASGHLGTVGVGIYLVACGYSGRVVVIRREPETAGS